MWAALKKDCMEYVVWEGPDTRGPSWFDRYLEERIFADEFNFYHTVDNDGTVYELTPGYSMFVCNDRGDVGLFTANWNLNEFVRINNRYLALKTEGFIYFLWDGNQNGPFPEWFVRSSSYHSLVLNEGEKWYITDDGAFLGSPWWVFLYNGSDVKYIEPYYFDKIFYHGERGRIKCSLH